MHAWINLRYISPKIAEGVAEAAVIPEISDADDGQAENATFELGYNNDDSEDSDIFDFVSTHFWVSYISSQLSC